MEYGSTAGPRDGMEYGVLALAGGAGGLEYGVWSIGVLSMEYEVRTGEALGGKFFSPAARK